MVTAPLSRAAWRPAWPRITAAARQAAARIAAWRLHAAVPALAGAALISAGVALIYLPAGLICAGAFALRLDSRIGS
jgi:hypothetical protein